MRKPPLNLTGMEVVEKVLSWKRNEIEREELPYPETMLLGNPLRISSIVLLRLTGDEVQSSGGEEILTRAEFQELVAVANECRDKDLSRRVPFQVGDWNVERVNGEGDIYTCDHSVLFYAELSGLYSPYYMRTK